MENTTSLCNVKTNNHARILQANMLSVASAAVMNTRASLPFTPRQSTLSVRCAISACRAVGSGTATSLPRGERPRRRPHPPTCAA